MECVVFGHLTYILTILGHGDLVTGGATIYYESMFFYDSDDVYCVLGGIFSRYTRCLADYIGSAASF